MDHHNRVRKKDKNRLPALANVLYYVQILRHVNFCRYNKSGIIFWRIAYPTKLLWIYEHFYHM